MRLGFDMITAASLVLVVFLSSLQTGAMEAKIRCDERAMHIYIDGILDGWTHNWEEVWTRNISGKSRLVAVRCFNNLNEGGLIASLANGLVSDETWKCRYYTDTNWYSLDTDDSSPPWNSAYVIPPSLVPQTWITSGTFPDSAKWIWKDSSFNSSKGSSLCRAELGVSIYVKCDGGGLVYADGVNMSTVDISKTKIIIPRTTHVVAIRGYNDGGTASIQAVFSNGYKTDTSWRCTNRYDSGWNLKYFDDSHWDQATDYGPGDIGVGVDVRKIWTANIVNDNYIYCRGHFECGCEYICKEHENEYDFHCICPEGLTLANDGLSCGLPTSPDETKASNTGLIAGIVTTLLVIVIVALLTGGFVWMRRRRARQDNDLDKAGRGDSKSRTANHVYYNVGRAAQRGEPSYENMQNQPDITGSSREQAHSNRQVQGSMSGDEAETTAGTVHELPHVYYNIGRVGNGDDTPYEDVSGLQNGALGDVSQPTEPAQTQASVYASLNRQLGENDERSPYTELA